MGIKDLPWVDHIALGLAHLAAILRQDMAEADDILVGRSVKEQRGYGMERIEPATRLVNGFADVVSLLLPFPDFLVLERVVPLGHRHGTRIVPSIGHLADAAHGATIWRRPGQFVHIGTMQIQVF